MVTFDLVFLHFLNHRLKVNVTAFAADDRRNIAPEVFGLVLRADLVDLRQEVRLCVLVVVF